MSSSETSIDHNQKAFDELRRCPSVAWPTLGLLAFAVCLAIASTSGYLSGALGLASAIGLNAVASYIAFTVLHEASHNAVSQTRWINDWAGRIAVPMIFPLPFFQSFRFIHMQHHRFTNESIQDPDEYAQSDVLWQLPFRWSTIDFSYLRCYFSPGVYASRPAKERRGFWISCAFLFGLPIVAWQFEFFTLYFLLYILPTRIALFILVWAFDYLPHHGCESIHRENPFRATLNRPGLEWLLTPVLLAQNYHLAHHLYPTVPFYRYLDVWRVREAYHQTQNPATSTTFGLGPRNVQG